MIMVNVHYTVWGNGWLICFLLLELRSDPDKFANAVLGLSDDMWILEDMQNM